ncbi:LuxR C-terminal-related transcriptional regulator [Microbacterium oleivorans]|uniref:Response regulator transcription factor n=1 Tax=Microbacterium oleivorans TaxID=273677 RepID=A0A7D5IX31_9MICO|nr:response regulator transcription factor [Microbacterium oleivorans]QLD12442.1 response regulator transcription factor [Microbacterium oleivorans]
MLGVLVIERFDLMRRGIADTIDAAVGMRVVAEASTVRQALTRAAVTGPDVAIIDAHLAVGDGAAACAALRATRPGVRCLVLADTDEDEARAASAAAGADGFLVKHVRAHELVDAVRHVAAGHPLSATLRPHSPLSATSEPDPTSTLTRRQRAVLELLAEGMSNREIAERLGLAEKTVKNHVTAILRTLGAERRTQAALIARHSPVHRRP